MEKLWGNNNKKGVDENESVNPTVYFIFAVLCEKDSKDLVEMMSFEWSRMNGKKLMIKDLTSFSTETPIAVYHLYNNGHMESLS